MTIPAAMSTPHETFTLPWWHWLESNLLTLLAMSTPPHIDLPALAGSMQAHQAQQEHERTAVHVVYEKQTTGQTHLHCITRWCTKKWVPLLSPPEGPLRRVSRKRPIDQRAAAALAAVTVCVCASCHWQ